jgi:MinD-like ATPase involved in chromosome partitioning or flagellar assembly
VTARVPVLTAVTDARWESGLVQAFESGDHGVAVVRRCLDLADLLATAASGTARAVLLSSDLRRLDRDALARLAVAGVAVVGLVYGGDEQAERRLRQLGVVHVLPADASAADIGAAVVDAVEAVAVTPLPLAAPTDPRGALPDLPPPPDTDDTGGVPLGSGRLVAVWGPTGAPGRTTVAVTLATELAGLGVHSVLIDADVYGGAVAQTLGLLDEAPGLAAAVRLANNGLLDLAGLAELARRVDGPAADRLRVLTGITRSDRWPEIRPAGVEAVLALCRQVAAVTVVDCAFSLEQDEELAYDQSAARRNGATLTVLENADTIVAVGSADPVSLQRLVRGLSDLAATVPGITPSVVVNRVRPGVMPGDPEAEIAAALDRYAGVTPSLYLPYDRKSADEAAMRGQSLAEAAPGSPLRLAMRDYAAGLAGVTVEPRGRRGGRA